MAEQDPLIAAAVKHIAESKPEYVVENAYLNALKQIMDTVRSTFKHPEDGLELAITVLNWTARHAETEPNIREKLQSFVKQLDRLSERW